MPLARMTDNFSKTCHMKIAESSGTYSKTI